MKKILSILLMSYGLMGYAQDKYIITGKIDGQVEGKKVYLYKTSYESNKVIDSTKIKKGQFKLKGSVPLPGLYQIVIDKTPKGEESSPKNWTSSRFYLENSPITFQGHVDSLTTYYYKPNKKAAVITGSKTQDEQTAYNESIKDLRSKISALDKEYSEKYHLPTLKGIYNTEEGIRISKEMAIYDKQLRESNLNFIKNNPKSVVALDLAMYNFIGMFVELTVPQIEELTAAIKQGWEGTPQYEEFLRYAEKSKKTALFSTYQDFELKNEEGNSVKISSFIKPGQYSMLEFWASWCGPCRGEIPHLVKINEKYKDAGFNIISISLDERDKDWRKAMNEEKMVWTQLNEPKGFDGEVSKAYNITGIPFAILLDPEGKIVDFNMRGAKLDAALSDIYGF